MFNQAMRALLAGNASEADALAERMLEVLTETGEPDALVVYGALLVPVRWYQGRSRELVDLLAGDTAGSSDLAIFRAMFARMYADAGLHEDAARLLDNEAITGFSYPNDLFLLGTLTAWAEAASILGDRVSAGILYEKLAPWPASVQAHDPLEGVVALYLGELATVLGRYDAAHSHFTQALALNQGLEAPFPVARTQLEWGKMLMVQGHPRQVAEARTRLQIALDIARSNGCARVEQRAVDLLGQV